MPISCKKYTLYCVRWQNEILQNSILFFYHQANCLQINKIRLSLFLIRNQHIINRILFLYFTVQLNYNFANNNKIYNMKKYLDLVSHVLKNGTVKTNRTGTDTLMVFGYHYKVNLQNGYPLVTTKKVYFNSEIRELLWN